MLTASRFIYYVVGNRVPATDILAEGRLSSGLRRKYIAEAATRLGYSGGYWEV